MSVWGAPWVSHKKRGLRSWVIVSLGRSPKNGAELIDEMERMSAGWWRPSPGSIYPLLDELAKEGLIRRKDDGRYELAGAAREHAGWPFARAAPRSAEEAVVELASLVSYLEDLDRAGPDRLGIAREELRAVVQRLTQLSRERQA